MKYVDPNGRETYLVISTFQGGGRENQGTNFDDAAATRANDIKKEERESIKSIIQEEFKDILHPHI